MQKLTLAIAAAALTGLIAAPALAQGTASAKAAFGAGGINLMIGSSSSGGETGLPATDSDHTHVTSILSAIIKAPKHKDLVVDVSLECGNFTQTEVKSKGGVKDTSKAGASVRVGVTVTEILNDGTDGVVIAAIPSGNPARTFDSVFGTVTDATEGVIFCRRTQQLEAVFQGILDIEVALVEVIGDEIGDDDGICEADEVCEPEFTNVEAFHNCLINDPDTGNVIIDPNCLTEEELNLIVDQMHATSFNYIAPDLPESGVYRVDVEAWLDTGASSENGSAEGKALIGLGTVFIETVRLAKGTEPVDIQ